MSGMNKYDGRPGRRTREQRIQELLRRSKTASTDKYFHGGRVKTGGHMPRPVTLPKFRGGDR